MEVSKTSESVGTAGSIESQDVTKQDENVSTVVAKVEVKDHAKVGSIEDTSSCNVQNEPGLLSLAERLGTESLTICSDFVCEECHKLFDRLEEARLQKRRIILESDFRSNYKTAREVHQSSRAGCIICVLLLEAYTSHDNLRRAVKMTGLPGPFTGAGLAGVPSIDVDNQNHRWTIALELAQHVEHSQKLVIIPHKTTGEPETEVRE